LPENCDFWDFFAKHSFSALYENQPKRRPIFLTAIEALSHCDRALIATRESLRGTAGEPLRQRDKGPIAQGKDEIGLSNPSKWLREQVFSVFSPLFASKVRKAKSTFLWCGFF
jgi:hypothetical protein